ncbi:hypothetical protein CAEBREN_03394 [Caenorhabditis brenneri]|uniref:Uncharacterized protein n=1 Tax=Caenorhabditis brenneri TaxID=135651 RepID=G0M7J6_CAEBE|nr:hypothetical protein CAEBREN_03394 [Caenorhabditis brenneri]
MKRGDDVDLRVYYYYLHSKSLYIAGITHGFLKIFISVILLIFSGSDLVEIYCLILFTVFIIIFPLKDKTTRKDLAICCKANSIYQEENRLENHANRPNNENRDNGAELEMEMGYFERQQRWAMNHQRFDGNGSPPLNFPPRA